MKIEIDMIKKNANQSPEQLAIVDGDREFSYSDVNKEVNRLSSALLSLSCGQGDRVALYLPNSFEFVTSYFSCSMINLIKVPIDYNIDLPSLEFILEDCKIKFLFIHASLLDKCTDILERNKFLDRIIVVGKSLSTNFDDKVINYNDIVKKGDENFSIILTHEEDKAIIIYSTGTTGRKKGVVFSNKKLLIAGNSINNFMGVDSPINEMILMPLTRSFGLARIRCAFLAKGTIVIETGLTNLAKIFKDFVKYQVNSLGSVPAGLEILLKKTFNKFSEVGKQLKFIEIGSAPMAKESKELLMSLFPNTKICMHYGLTEASRACFISFHEEKEKLNSVGKATPVSSLRVVNEKGEIAKAGEIGELQVKSLWVLDEYWGQSELNTKVFIDKWFCTGDSGKQDDDGYFYYVGRNDDIINVGGYKVSPTEIESVLNSYDGVKESAVIGFDASDRILGTNITAYIVPTIENKSNFNALAHQLHDFCRNKLRTDVIPQTFHLIEIIPKTDSGKFQRQKLRGHKLGACCRFD